MTRYLGIIAGILAGSAVFCLIAGAWLGYHTPEEVSIEDPRLSEDESSHADPESSGAAKSERGEK